MSDTVMVKPNPAAPENAILRHPVSGLLVDASGKVPAAGRPWLYDGFTCRMLTDRAILRADDPVFAAADPAATPAADPAATRAADPAATPAAGPVATPAAGPAATPAVDPAATPAADPAAASTLGTSAGPAPAPPQPAVVKPDPAGAPAK